MDIWQRVRAGLEAVAAHSEPPEGGRLGAVLVLLREAGDGDVELVLTRRREDMRSHPGQISFPGGRVDPGESPEQAAVREAVEEVALQPDSVEVLGRLPAFYIPPSRFWMHAVLARWVAPHELVPAEAEVAEVLHVRKSSLINPAKWRSVELSSGGHTWAWQLDERHLLWGATAVVTSVVLGLLDPQWSGGVTPDGLGVERSLRPWENAPVPKPRVARLPHVPDVALDDITALSADELRGPPRPEVVARVAQAAAAALLGLFPGRVVRPLILIGPGGTGVVGAATAAVLQGQGVACSVVLSRPLAALPEATQAALQNVTTSPFSQPLPDADVVLDALLGAGTRGRLNAPELDVVLALRHVTVPVVSIDLPSGLDPERGLMGEAVTADVTIAIDGVRSGLLVAGIEPFAGDIYLAVDDATPLRRLVRKPAGGWAE